MKKMISSMECPIGGSNRILLLCSGLAGLIPMSGCSAPGRYVLNGVPTESTRSFKNVGVAKVEVGTLAEPVNESTAAELRGKLVERIGKKRIYQSVELEAAGDSILEIQPRIIAFQQGSRTARYMLGNLAGKSAKARMDVQCRFINKDTGQTIADGTFIGEIATGFFGGSADQSLLSSYVAQHVADFLKKGR